MPKAFGYIRVSTNAQQYSLEYQQEVLERYYDATLKPQGYTWAGIFSDPGKSGKVPFSERPGGLRVWVDASEGDAILVTKMDRLFRSVSDGAKTIEALNARKIDLHSLDIRLDTGTPMGRFVAYLMTLLAELEREWISQRTREALSRVTLKGTPKTNQCPPGWKHVDGEWVADFEERNLIQWLHSEHDAGRTMTGLLAAIKATNRKRANGRGYHKKWLYYARHSMDQGWPLIGGTRSRFQAAKAGRQ